MIGGYKEKVGDSFFGENATDEKTIGDILITIHFQAENIKRLCIVYALLAKG